MPSASSAFIIAITYAAMGCSAWKGRFLLQKVDRHEKAAPDIPGPTVVCVSVSERDL